MCQKMVALLGQDGELPEPGHCLSHRLEDQGQKFLQAVMIGVWASTDGGDSWTRVMLPGAPGDFDRIEADIAPSNPSVAYAWGAKGNTAHLWRRASGNWTAITPPPV